MNNQEEMEYYRKINVFPPLRLLEPKKYELLIKLGFKPLHPNIFKSDINYYLWINNKLFYINYFYLINFPDSWAEEMSLLYAELQKLKNNN